MLAAVLYGKEDIRLEMVDDPIPEAGEVVIRVAAATTCGTDLKVWRRGGHARMLKPPTLFGHEAAGEIVAIGAGVTQWRVGDRVVANNSAPCMECFFCRKQEYSLCPHLCFNNGTFAQYQRIPAAIVQTNLLPIPDNLPDALAALTEPLACVLHGVARSPVQSGDRVVVLGDGAIGLMLVGALALGYGRPEKLADDHPSPTPPPTGLFRSDVEIILIGGHDARLALGRDLGATHTFNYHAIDPIPALIKRLTDDWGADLVIEATGSPAVWEMAIAATRPGGTVTLFGGCPRDTTITVSTEQLHYNELTLKGVFHNTPRYVRDALAMLASRALPLERLISSYQPLQNLEQVFHDMRERQAIKVAMVP